MAGMRNIHDLADLIARHAPTDGITATAMARASLVRSANPTMPMPTTYAASFCLVAQGAKEAQIGEDRHIYNPETYLICAVDLPITGAVVEASAERPYLCLCLELDLETLADLIAAEPETEARRGDAPAGLQLVSSPPEMIDAAARLLALLDRPQEAGSLAPLTERELLWRLLQSPAGDMLRSAVDSESRLGRIARAVRYLRQRFAEPVSVEQLAGVAGMSPSAFHQHFKQVTGQSPLRFRTLLRLQHARRLMLANAMEAAVAGYEAGYSSPSQFSRDYVREFGVPPRQDIVRLRAAGGLPEVA